MLENLKEEVCAANLDLVAKGVVISPGVTSVAYPMTETMWSSSRPA